MFIVGTLGLGLLYLFSSLLVVLAVGSLYGAAAAQMTAVACGALGVFAGVVIGALLAGTMKHPLQSQLEEVVREAASRRRASGRHSGRSDSPYAREKDAPTYGDQGEPVAAGPSHGHDAPWRPTAIDSTGATTSAPYEAPSFDSPSPSSGITSKTRSAIKRARGLRDAAPVTEVRQRVEAGDIEGAVEAGRKAVEKALDGSPLDELYAEVPGLLATYRSGGGRALLGQLGDRARAIAAETSGQQKADAEQLGQLFDRLEVIHPSDVPGATWIRILSNARQLRGNPRGFLKTVLDAIAPEDGEGASL